MLGAGVPSFCLLGQSYAIREIETGADHEANAAEHVEDAAPNIRCQFHRCARSKAALRLAFLLVSLCPLALADFA